MIEDYLEYSTMQESPRIYHTWIAISAMAACLERNVWIDRGFFKIYPNLYVMIMGDSAVYAKSTAINMGTDLLDELADKPNIYEGQITVPALIKSMAADRKDEFTGKYVPNSRVLLLAPELSLFLRDEMQAREIVYFLTDFYTGKSKPWKKNTITGGGEVEVRSPCINFLAGSTAQWLATGLTQSDFGGGFMGRCIFVVPNTPPRKVANPFVTGEQRLARDKFLADLKRLRTLRGEFKLDADAAQFYENWYMTQPSISSMDNLASYFKRKAENILKIGLINAAMLDHDEITAADLQWAIDMLFELEATMTQAFQYIGTEESILAETIMSHLRANNGKDSTPRLLTMLGSKLRNKRQFESVVDMLKEQGRIFWRGDGTGGNKGMIYLKERED